MCCFQNAFVKFNKQNTSFVSQRGSFIQEPFLGPECFHPHSKSRFDSPGCIPSGGVLNLAQWTPPDFCIFSVVRCNVFLAERECLKLDTPNPRGLKPLGLTSLSLCLPLTSPVNGAGLTSMDPRSGQLAAPGPDLCLSQQLSIGGQTDVEYNIFRVKRWGPQAPPPDLPHTTMTPVV